MAKKAMSKKKTSQKTTKKAAKKSTAKKTSKAGNKKTAKKAKATKTSSLPKVGAHVQWKSLPGMVKGKVVAILTKDTTLNGKKVKASEDEPRIKLKSDSSGKLCIHKPESVSPA